MSTPAQIGIEQADGTLCDCLIYKHSDGYPSGVLPFLSRFVEKFYKNRGHDPEYCLAQLLRHWVLEDKPHDDMMRERFGDTQSEYLGWGVGTGWHGDIEYFYRITREGKIRVFDPQIPYDPCGAITPDTWPDVTEDAFREAATPT